MITVLAGILGIFVGLVLHALIEHALIARDRAKLRHMLRRALVVGRLKHGPMLGADLTDEIILPRSILYVTLAKLEDEGVIEGYPEPSPPCALLPRRMYRLPRSAP